MRQMTLLGSKRTFVAPAQSAKSGIRLTLSKTTVFARSRSAVALETAGTDVSRIEELAENALDEAPAFPLLPECDGYLALPKLTSGCPSSPFINVAFGTARVLDPIKNLWELRKIEMHYGPTGRGTTTYSVVLRNEGGVWEWVREEVLVIFD